MLQKDFNNNYTVLQTLVLGKGNVTSIHHFNSKVLSLLFHDESFTLVRFVDVNFVCFIEY